MYFCRECNSFLSIKPIRLKCLKCDSEKIEDSDFPSPDGQIILQCKMCKKMFTAKELLEKLNIKDDSPKEEEKKEEQKPQEPKKKRQAKDW
jgi:DNA-directed RNA polymerase subunit M/transcription elongation factor TFIIS